jgi:hypothetical protein
MTVYGLFMLVGSVNVCFIDYSPHINIAHYVFINTSATPLPCLLTLPLAGCGAQSLSLYTSKMINFEGGGGRETTMRSARYQSLLSKPFDQSDCQLMINE